MYDVAEQIKHYNGIGDSGKSKELKTHGRLGMLAFSVYYWVLGEFVFVPDRRQEKGILSGGGS